MLPVTPRYAVRVSPLPVALGTIGVRRLGVRQVPEAWFGRAHHLAGWECTLVRGPHKLRGLSDRSESRDVAVKAFVMRLQEHGYTGRYKVRES